MEKKFFDMDSIPKNYYSRNIEESYKWFYELQSAAIRYHGEKFPIEIWNKLFKKNNCKIVSSEIDLKLDSCKRTAVILMGLSCCGKTTYARGLKEKYPRFELCLFDEIEGKVMSEFIEKNIMLTHEIADTIGVSKFGEVLNKHGKAGDNIIIDGQFVRSNSRGALIKTLRQIGYTNIILLDFLNIPRRDVIERLKSRALEEVMYDYYAKNNSIVKLSQLRTSMFGKDATSLITEIMPIEDWKKTPEYKKEYSEHYRQYFELEPIDSGYPFQKQYDLFTSGVDKYLSLY